MGKEKQKRDRRRRNQGGREGLKKVLLSGEKI
jgi:hypothetical protein